MARHRKPKRGSKLRAVTTAAVVATLSTLGLAQAGAADPEQAFVARDTTTAGVQADSTVSTVTANLVTLVQDGRASANAGTSAETTNLGYAVEAGGYLTVDYVVEDLAQANNGSVRFFAYYESNADTWSTAPDIVATAGNELFGESLILSIPEDGVIGTVGVVYDTSNGGVPGTVTFANLAYGPPDPLVSNTPISFVPGVTPDPLPNNDFGKAVAEYVKANGGPPPHANAKVNR